MPAIRDRIRALWDPLRAKLAPAVNGMKTIGSGVTFIGDAGARNVIRLDGTSDPDADKLTRGIALATSAYAYTAIMYRATRLAEPPLDVVQETEDEGEIKIPDHELAMLLDEPSKDYDMGELQQLTETYRCVSGACLWVKETDNAGRPARWTPFSADEFEAFPADDRIYGRFKVTTRAGRTRTYDADEVVHFRDLNPNSWRKQLPKLEVALADLDTSHQVNRTVRNYLKRAMFPGGLVSPDPKWNPDEEAWKEWKNTIMAWHQGPAMAGKPLILQGGTTFSKAALALSELLPKEILDRIESTVGSVFGIPPVVLGWKVGLENSPWSQMSEARQMTYEETIEPRWRDVEKKMTRQLLEEEERMAGRSIRFDTSKVRAFTHDDKLRAGVAGSMRREWTRNERRIYTGMDPLEDGDDRGDEIEGGAGTGGLFGEGGGGIMGLFEESFDERQAEALTAGMRLVLDQAKLLSDPKAREWSYFDIGTKAAESTWTREVKKVLDAWKKETLRLFDRMVTEKAADGEVETKQEEEPDPDSIAAFLSALGEFLRTDGESAMESTTLPLIISTGEAGLRRAAAQVDLSFTVLEPGLADFAAEEAEFLAEAMGETTGQFVADTVQKQLDEGGLIADIRKALEKDKAFSRTRAQLTARTETTRAWNGAQTRGLSDWEDDQEEGVQVLKKWLDSGDIRVRAAHRAAGKKDPIPIDQPYDVDGKKLQHPSEPNCRCTQLFSIEDDSEEED